MKFATKCSVRASSASFLFLSVSFLYAFSNAVSAAVFSVCRFAKDSPIIAWASFCWWSHNLSFPSGLCPAGAKSMGCMILSAAALISATNCLVGAVNQWIRAAPDSRSARARACKKRRQNVVFPQPGAATITVATGTISELQAPWALRVIFVLGDNNWT